MVADLLGLDIENRLAPGREVVVREASTARGVISLECGGEVVFSYSVASLVWVYAPPDGLGIPGMESGRNLRCKTEGG